MTYSPPAQPEGSKSSPDPPAVSLWGLAAIWGPIMGAIGSGHVPALAAAFAVCVASVAAAAMAVMAVTILRRQPSTGP